MLAAAKLNNDMLSYVRLSSNSSFASLVYTVRSAQKTNLLKQTHVTGHNPPIVEGSAIGSDAASGQVRVVRDVSEISTIKPGEILVADMTVRVLCSSSSHIMAS